MHLSSYPSRLLVGWSSLLALVWLGICAPWPAAWTWSLAAIVLAAAVAAIWHLTRKQRQRRELTAQLMAAVDGTFRALPEDLKRHTPLVLTIGEPATLARAFGDDSVRITDAAIWVRCDQPDVLMHRADALKRWREGRSPDAIVLLLAADQRDTDSLTLAMTLKRWRSAIGQACRAVGTMLPVGLAAYLEEPQKTVDACPWFGVSQRKRLHPDTLAAKLLRCLERYTFTSAANDSDIRAGRSATLMALAGWVSRAVMPVLLDTRHGNAALHVTAFGMTMVPGMPVRRSPFSEFVCEVTGLALRPDGDRARVRYPLPNAIVRGFPVPPADPILPRAIIHGALCLLLFVTAALVASARQNWALAQHVAAHVTQYQSLPVERDAERQVALAALKRDRNALVHYAITGVPWRLGFGLYQGNTWVPVLEQLIASYRPPQPVSVIELDSMSLFASGSATLNKGANRVLIQALRAIESHPDKRVLVAGHTDDVGSPEANLRLSVERARAVRDWLVEASGLSPTRFAIQGYGDTRPKASNATEAGRAANRRVEITLIPDCRDQAGNSSNQGPPACS